MMPRLLPRRSAETFKNGSPYVFLNRDGARLHSPRFWFDAAMEVVKLKDFTLALSPPYVCEQISHEGC
jgi:hypothetical protein